ncbi:MAG: TetR/AcrR family transcriptional regulator [Filomicrobium sp.]
MTIPASQNWDCETAARLVTERSDILPILGEVFREHGVEGASLSTITEATGLGKGSLYHFFPGGKDEMVEAVLAEIGDWFEQHVFQPLETTDDPERAVNDMLDAVLDYFHSGRRGCLIGALSLAKTRDSFSEPIQLYFKRWLKTLARALERLGHSRKRAKELSEMIVLGIQGALVLARASDDRAIFTRAIGRLRTDVAPVG